MLIRSFYTCALILLLSACSTHNAQIMTKSLVQQNAELSYLPLLTVTSISSVQGGYKAQLHDTNNTPFNAVVLKETLGKFYTKISKGDTVKIVGDYTDKDTVEIKATKIVIIK